MKLFAFSFKNEAKWILILSLAFPAMGVLIALAVLLMRHF